MTRHSSIGWLIFVLVVLVAGMSVSAATSSSARRAADQRLTSGASFAALESMLVARMTLATHGAAPFARGDDSAEEARIREHQTVLLELASHPESEISAFVSATLSIRGPEDAAREYDLATLIIDTRSAVLDPLDEKANARARAAWWSPVVTGVLGVGGIGGTLWSLVRAPTRHRDLAAAVR